MCLWLFDFGVLHSNFENTLRYPTRINTMLLFEKNTDELGFTNTYHTTIISLN